MPPISSYLYYAVHPSELRSIIQWNIWHEPVHTRNEESETLSLRQCFKYLDLTSRSFSAVIKELNHEQLVPVCTFYLILRGLDTIEDDMTIPTNDKMPILRNFHNVLEQEGWHYNGNGPDEKDRELLVNFYHVVTEFNQIKPAYREIIRDITKRMGNGMADFVENAEYNTNGIETVKDYELYCHYVAGLVGEGLTRLFVEAEQANPALLQRTDLHESMSQFLQQTNIVRDVREDWNDKRRFWPKEIWSKYVDDFEDLFKEENREAALRCSSEMVLLALRHADDCLFYLAGLKDQSVFNFCAIPQSMAIATLELCFRNPAIFERNVKISKGQACRLMIHSSQNLHILFGVFKEYARKIHKKNDPRDPNFLKISVACGKIEQFIESIFPSQDPKAIVRTAGAEIQPYPDVSDDDARERAAATAAKWDIAFTVLVALGFLLIMSILTLFMAWMMGARFDLALKEGFFGGKPEQSGYDELKVLAQERAHKEL